jgi:hypothetical protein
MNTHVFREITTMSTSVVAFVTGEWSINGRDMGCRLKNSSPLATGGGRCAISTSRFRCNLNIGYMAALAAAHCFVRITTEGRDILIFERRLNGAQNQILPRAEIARKPSFERSPNAARRQFLARADRGENELRDGGLESVVRCQCHGGWIALDW